MKITVFVLAVLAVSPVFAQPADQLTPDQIRALWAAQQPNPMPSVNDKPPVIPKRLIDKDGHPVDLKAPSQ